LLNSWALISRLFPVKSTGITLKELDIALMHISLALLQYYLISSNN
jgi:hypothetical protein